MSIKKWFLMIPLSFHALSSAQADDSYDVAAFYWPSCHHDARWSKFFPGGGEDGEWESIRNCKPKWDGHWQPRVPEWGYLHDNDPKAMEKKIEAATSHGVNVMIFDWYWFDLKNPPKVDPYELELKYWNLFYPKQNEDKN